MSLWDPQFYWSGSVMRNSQIWPPEDITIFVVSWFICSSERLYMRVSVCVWEREGRGQLGSDVPGTWGVSVLYWARMNQHLPDCAKHEGFYTWTELRIKCLGVKLYFWTCEYMVIGVLLYPRKYQVQRLSCNKHPVMELQQFPLAAFQPVKCWKQAQLILVSVQVLLFLWKENCDSILWLSGSHSPSVSSSEMSLCQTSSKIDWYILQSWV